VDSYGSHTLVPGPYDGMGLDNKKNQPLSNIYIFEPTSYKADSWKHYYICYNFITGVWADFGDNSPNALTSVGSVVTGSNDDGALFAFTDPYAIPAPALFDGDHSTVVITTDKMVVSFLTWVTNTFTGTDPLI
jgi:hypothetical protein